MERKKFHQDPDFSAETWYYVVRRPGFYGSSFWGMEGFRCEMKMIPLTYSQQDMSLEFRNADGLLLPFL